MDIHSQDSEGRLPAIIAVIAAQEFPQLFEPDQTKNPDYSPALSCTVM